MLDHQTPSINLPQTQSNSFLPHGFEGDIPERFTSHCHSKPSSADPPVGLHLGHATKNFKGQDSVRRIVPLTRARGLMYVHFLSVDVPICEVQRQSGFFVMKKTPFLQLVWQVTTGLHSNAERGTKGYFCLPVWVLLPE